MKAYAKIFVFAFVVSLMTLAIDRYDTAQAAPQDDATDPAVVQPADDQITDPADPADPIVAKRLTRKQKRELGILPRQVLFKVRELAKNGDITKEMTAREMAFVYATEVATMPEHAVAWSNIEDAAPGWDGVDWDGVIAFLEKLFELLMKFIPIFL